MNVRPATLSDAASIAEIYNFYVLNTRHTFETEPVGAAEMRARIGEILRAFPFYIAEDAGAIAGYAYAARYKLREAYRHSVEVSVYVSPQQSGRGIGTALYENLLPGLKSFHAVVAGVALPNEASIRLHEKFGFEKVAHFREIGFKFGERIDVGYWEKLND